MEMTITKGPVGFGRVETIFSPSSSTLRGMRRTRRGRSSHCELPHPPPPQGKNCASAPLKMPEPKSAAATNAEVERCFFREPSPDLLKVCKKAPAQAENVSEQTRLYAGFNPKSSLAGSAVQADYVLEVLKKMNRCRPITVCPPYVRATPADAAPRNEYARCHVISLHSQTGDGPGHRGHEGPGRAHRRAYRLSRAYRGDRGSLLRFPARRRQPRHGYARLRDNRAGAARADDHARPRGCARRQARAGCRRYVVRIL